MTNPPLIGWRLAQIAPLATTTTMDPYAREARSLSPFGAVITIRCQEDDNPTRDTRSPGGSITTRERGVLLRRSDCVKAGYTPGIGDLWQGTLNRHGVTEDATRLYVSAIQRRGYGSIAFAYYALDLSTEAPERRDA